MKITPNETNTLFYIKFNNNLHVKTLASELGSFNIDLDIEDKIIGVEVMNPFIGKVIKEQFDGYVLLMFSEGEGLDEEGIDSYYGNKY